MPGYVFISDDRIKVINLLEEVQEENIEKREW